MCIYQKNKMYILRKGEFIGNPRKEVNVDNFMIVVRNNIVSLLKQNETR